MADKKKNDADSKEKSDTKVPPKDEEQDLSEEDKQLQESLNLMVERLTESDQKHYRQALECLRTEIRASTTSMTSVPKPLKFLRPHYGSLKKAYEKISDEETKRFCADIISVLGMTMSEERDSLKFRLLGSNEEIGSWGHEYVRHLAGEVIQEWQETSEKDGEIREKLISLAKDIVPYHMEHNAEAEACDLLMEIEQLDLLEEHVDENVYPRVCLYLTSCVPYVPDPENTILIRKAVHLYRKFKQYPHAMRFAMQVNDLQLMREIFYSCDDLLMQKQLSYMLGRQQIYMELDEGTPELEEIKDIMFNTHLNGHFLALGSEVRTTIGSGNVDSARQNLAASFVNGFVNAAFGKDKLIMEGNEWLNKNKDIGMLSATASLGLILLWDLDGGLSKIDKYLYSHEDNIKAGALLACGIVSSGVRHECDPARALLNDYVLDSKLIMRIGSIVGLGLAYAGSNREDVINLLLPVLGDSKSTTEIIGMAALSCGLISVGSCNGDVSSTIIQKMMEWPQADLNDTYTRYLSLGLALTYLGKQEAVEATLAALEAVVEPLKSMTQMLVNICAYAGTGNVLKIQQLLHLCSEHDESKDQDGNDKKDDKKKKEDKKDEKKDKDDKDKDTVPAKPDLSAQQGFAVLGIALISMGEEIGAEMSFRAFGHLLRYGEPVIRRAVPLALALVSASNPKLQILDTLSKFSHDSDSEVSYNAILAMGIVGAGTNNARLAAMLRQLAGYHAKDPNNLFMVRLAQGLTHLGKGTLTLCPYHSDRSLMSPVAVAGLLSVLISCLDVKTIILGKSHYVLYHLVSALQPRMLVTFDEQLKPVGVSVRVGQAVNVVGQAGKPKTITGFQTHTTPVLLAYGERAELATDEYFPLTPVMEGVVILRKNPNYEA
uniref:26S proteasome non-ATPase regulatory subunit 2 n=1 Tax=Octopus bimaculoides TaxID=37653 RepID=A0A0L8GBA9_OCTBM